MKEWISVKDNLPSSNVFGSLNRYLVYGVTTCGRCYEEPCVFEATWGDDGEWFQYGEYRCHVEATHWMPLPKPPEIV